MEAFRSRLEHWQQTSVEEKKKLASAMDQRSSDELMNAGIAALKNAYPSASAAMLETGAYHLFVELPVAVRDLLAWNELSLRSEMHEEHHGAAWKVIYHVYNWMQLDALMPLDSADVRDELEELKSFLNDNDKESALQTLESLMEIFSGRSSPTL